MTARTTSDITELIPLADRVRWMAVCRVAGVATVTVLWWLLPGWGPLVAQLLVPGAVLLFFSLPAAVLTPRLPRAHAVGLFTAALIADGLYLAWTLHLTGGLDSPAVYLAAVQVTAAALLGSFGTGLKLALWNSLATLIVLEAHATGLLVPPPGTAPAGVPVDLRAYTLYLLPIWTAALVTATFAAVNERELRRRRYDAEALRALSVELERSGESTAVAAALLRFVTAELGATRAGVTFWTADPTGDGRSRILPPTLWTVPGRAAPVTGREAIPSGRSLARLAERRGRPVLSAGFRSEDESFLVRFMPSDGNTVLIPLLVDQTVHGVLAFQHPARRGSGIERRTLSAAVQASAHASMGLARSVLLAGLRAAAMTDGLTGLSNRRAFDEALRTELDAAADSGESVGLLLIDLDHFKRLNDTLGHLAGDDVLRAVADMLQRQAREGDTPARYGGEELALVLPGADFEAATLAAERVRRAIAATRAPVRVTASLGVAVYPSCAGSAAELVAAADRAMYAAKLGGRDQVQIAQPVGHIPAQRPEPGVPAPAQRF
jgi:two-component system cell cycle response regulator